VRRQRDGTVLIAVSIVLFALVLSACGGSESSEPAGPPDGAMIYARNCAACHSVDGSGGVGLNLIGVHDRLTRPEMSEIILGGRNAMPAWDGRLDAAEVRAVIDHLETFSAP
jgi:cytochrome c oxidase cbb3-type subunit 3